jgi:hypothetical protein
VPDADEGTEEHPYDAATAALADLAERAVEYADIWRDAITRNAAGDYKPEDLLVHVQALWGLGARDAARMGSAMLEAVAPMFPKDGFSTGAADAGSTTD